MNTSITGPAVPFNSPSKPIRFVQNTDGPYAKRRRINSACLTCRKRKTRCSGERPVCQTCLQNKHKCGGYGDDTEHSSQRAISANQEDSQESRKRSSQINIHTEALAYPSPVRRTPSTIDGGPSPFKSPTVESTAAHSRESLTRKQSDSLHSPAGKVHVYLL
jgi:hypothetical protein